MSKYNGVVFHHEAVQAELCVPRIGSSKNSGIMSSRRTRTSRAYLTV